jgi:RNA polymerase sigma factor (sigma-70 family)
MPTNAVALTRLLVRERPSLLRLARRIVGDAPAAEDVTQSLWLRIQGIEDDPPILHKRAFLYRLAANLATDRARTERRYDSLFEMGEPVRDVPHDAPSAERQLLDREQLDLLMCAVDDLSPRCREVFILRKLEDMPVHAICQRLGISRSMVARHMDNALRHLFARMQDGAE